MSLHIEVLIGWSVVNCCNVHVCEQFIGDEEVSSGNN